MLVSYEGIFFQLFSSRPVSVSRLSGVDWPRLFGSIAWNSLGLVGIGLLIALQGSSFIVAVLFALPAVLVIGALNGFASAIQKWILHLPEWRVAAIGALLIFCAFALFLARPLFNLMN